MNYSGLREAVGRSAFHIEPLAPGNAQVPAGIYQPLIETLALMRRDRGVGVIVAFASVSGGEGATSVIESLAWELSKQTGEQTLLTTPMGLVSAASARFGDASNKELAFHPVRRLRSTSSASQCQDAPELLDFAGLRRRFGFILADCPALWRSLANDASRSPQIMSDPFHAVPAAGLSRDASSGALSVCRACDGVILVVSAGDTQRKDIRHAQSMLQVASANLLGFVLNKRVESIPPFISRFFR